MKILLWYSGMFRVGIAFPMRKILDSASTASFLENLFYFIFLSAIRQFEWRTLGWCSSEKVVGTVDSKWLRVERIMNFALSDCLRYVQREGNRGYSAGYSERSAKLWNELSSTSNTFRKKMLRTEQHNSTDLDVACSTFLVRLNGHFLVCRLHFLPSFLVCVLQLL